MAKIRIGQALPNEIEHMLFRVTQEALTNVARHSAVTEVEFDLTCEDNQVVITVCDNGRGFNVASAEGKGVGLSSMRERVEALGGTLSLESTPGRGTSLRAQCIVKREGSI